MSLLVVCSLFGIYTYQVVRFIFQSKERYRASRLCSSGLYVWRLKKDQDLTNHNLDKHKRATGAETNQKNPQGLKVLRALKLPTRTCQVQPSPKGSKLYPSNPPFSSVHYDL